MIRKPYLIVHNRWCAAIHATWTYGGAQRWIKRHQVNAHTEYAP